MIADAFAQGRRLEAEGRRGPDVLQHIVRSLCCGLSRATPAAVMQALQSLAVPVRTPFSEYVSELRCLVGNVRCIGQVALEDGTTQIVLITGVNDQFAGLSAQIFAGRNMRALPFEIARRSGHESDEGGRVGALGWWYDHQVDRISANVPT